MRRRLSSRGQRAAVLRDGLEEEEGFIGGGGKGYLIAAARAKVCARHGIVDEGRIRLTSQKSRKGEARVEYCMWVSRIAAAAARQRGRVIMFNLKDDFPPADGAQINVSAKSLLKGGTSRASMSFH
jgi:hypothetical protein